jgi:hypothetical protein
MSWIIQCCDPKCGQTNRAENVVELINAFCDADGWFICQACEKTSGYIAKEFRMQELDREPWRPLLRGLVQLVDNGNDDPESEYRPFVFLATYDKPTNPIADFWFCYYKDTRAKGGNLKLGHGPGGPPVLSAKQILQLIAHALDHNIIERRAIETLLNASTLKGNSADRRRSRA